MAAEGFHRHVAFMRAGLPKRASRTARLMAAMRGYVRFAETHPHLFSLMFSSQHGDFTDPQLGAAAAQSYGVLREIAAGLDWDKADAPDGSLRAEMMLWSLVHGYAQLSLNGQFASDPATGRPAAFDSRRHAVVRLSQLTRSLICGRRLEFVFFQPV